MIFTRLAALLLSAVVAAAPAEPVVQPTLTLNQLPGEIQPYGEHTADEEKLLLLTSCTLSEGTEAIKDVTADFADKAAFHIPEQAVRGYVFELRPAADLTAADLGYSVEAFLNSGSCPDRLNRLKHTVPGTIESLQESGFSTVEQAVDAGFTELFVDMNGFWGLECGWRSVSDRTRFRDWAIPDSLDEMYVTSGYLYERYLRTGSRYEKLQPEFVGIALTHTVQSGIVTEEDRVLLVFSVPTTASVVAADLGAARLLRTDGTFVGPYVIRERTDDTLLLGKNPCWQRECPCDAPDILCRVDGTENSR